MKEEEHARNTLAINFRDVACLSSVTLGRQRSILLTLHAQACFANAVCQQRKMTFFLYTVHLKIFNKAMAHALTFTET